MTTENAPETKEETKRRKAKERKQKQIAREEKLGMKPWIGKVSRGERAMLDEKAEPEGFEDRTEFMIWLVQNHVPITKAYF